MRYTPTLKLSTRLASFVTLIVISAMFILFIGGAFSFKRVGQDYLIHYLQGVVDVVDQEMGDPDVIASMKQWMPKILQASNVVEVKIFAPDSSQVIYHFKDTESHIATQLLYEKSFELKRHSGYQITFSALPPYQGYRYSLAALWAVAFAIGLVIFCLVWGIKWLKQQFHGSELLEERSRMILAGRVEEHAKGDVQEWPFTASEALDKLIEELQDARQERSRFDTFIRSHTFLDQLTGTANRVMFDSKLEATLSESGTYGGVLLLRLDGWDSLLEVNGKKVADDFIVEIGSELSNILQRYSNVILSRYYESDFAILMPHKSAKDVANIASSCVKQLEKMTPPEPVEPDNWFHIGVSMYQEGERRGRILNEAEIALKSAQLQNMNAWSRFQKQANANQERGSVRWRTLFDQVLTPNKVKIYQQPCYLFSEDQTLHIEHYELFTRIDDLEQGLIKASHFHSALESVGYETLLDRSVLVAMFRYMKTREPQDSLSINLYVSPFSDKNYVKWLRDELLQLSKEWRRALIFDFSEANLVQHLDYMRPVIRMISGLGSRICVGQAGRSIISTYYLKDLDVDFLKLHRSLIKQIDQRHENQLFVRSLVGACAGLKTQVIALGVSNKREQATLMELGVDGVQGRYLAPEVPLLPEKSVIESPQPAKVQPGRRKRWRS